MIEIPPLSDLTLFAFCLVSAFSVALFYWSFCKSLGIRGRCVPVLQSVTLSILALALWIPPERMGLRALALVVCIELWFKMADFTRQSADRSSSAAISFWRYARFLVPFPVMLVVFGKKERKISPPFPFRRSLIRMVVGAACFGLGFALVHFANGFPFVKSNFAFDHLLKVSIFILTIESLSMALRGAERLAGFDTKPLIRFQFLSRSVGDYWSRYNTRVHEWFKHNVFRPAGGVKRPIRSLFLVFFVSAVFHEIGMGIATSRFDGYQFIFFFVQAPMVLLSHRFYRATRHRGILGSVLTHSFTLVWMFFSSV